VDSRRPDLRAEPWSVAATQVQIRDDRWLTFKIYARSAQSLDERPIPLKLTFEFEEMSEDHESFKDWLKYGKAFEGVATLETDLPGGLGTGGPSGRVIVTPADVSRNEFRNRQQIVGPDGTVLAELSYALTSTSGPERTGIRVHGEDDSGLITVESLFDVETQSGTMHYTLKPLPGVVASKALPALIFARHMCRPNMVRVAAEYGPFEDQLELTASETLVTEDLTEIIRDLSTVQQRTSVPVLIPDFHDYTLDDLKEIRRAAWVIEGRTIIQKWTTFEVPVHPHIEVEPGSHYAVQAGTHLRLPKITGDVVLGLVRHLLPSTTIASLEGDVVRLVPYRNDMVYHSMVDSLPDAPPGKVAVLFVPIPEDQERGTELEVG
jgi:hypothetical protein